MKKTVLCLTSVIIFISCHLFLLSTAINAQENNPNSSLLNSSNNKSGQLSAEELVNRGADKNSFGRAQESIEDCTAALAVPGIRNDTKALAFLNRGVAKSSLGRPQESIEDCTAALAVPGIRNDTKATALMNRGVAKSKLGDHQGEIADYTSALRIPGIRADTKAITLNNLNNYKN